MIHGPKYEKELMTMLLSPQIANSPLNFVKFSFPWGKEGTPLARFSGPRKWQRDVLLKIQNHIEKNNEFDPNMLQMAIASGRGIGKSALVSWVILWMLSTRMGSSAIVSANGEPQLRSVTWGELAKWVTLSINSHWWDVSATRISPHKWLAEKVSNELKIGSRYWGAEGRLWTEENPDAYAGAHNPNGMLLMFDEASGIPDPIWAVARGFFTEKISDRYWFAFSNPRRPSGYFYDCFNSKCDIWDTTQIDARTVEEIDQKVFEGIISEYGPDSNEAKVEVYGQFPEDSDEMFISGHVIKEAQARELPVDESAPIIIGIDPARGGDMTVILVRQGRHIQEIDRFSVNDTMEIVGRVIDKIRKWNPDMVVIDEGGLGFGILDRLKEQRYDVRGVNFAWASRHKMRWKNKRAEMWDTMREWLKGASIPNDKRLAYELASVKIKRDSLGAVQLQPKADLNSSPDIADALAVTFAFPVANDFNDSVKLGKKFKRSADHGPTLQGAHSWLGA